MRRPTLLLSLLPLLLATSAFGQVLIDTSNSRGRGVNATTIRVNGSLLTPLPCCPAGDYTVDLQWDPTLVALVPVNIVTGPVGPVVPSLGGIYNANLTLTQTCANPALNGTFGGTGLLRLAQRGDFLTGFGGVVFPAISAVDGFGIEATVTASAATGQVEVVTQNGNLGTGSFTSTVGVPTIGFNFSGSIPASACQFSGSGNASRLP